MECAGALSPLPSMKNIDSLQFRCSSLMEGMSAMKDIDKVMKLDANFPMGHKCDKELGESKCRPCPVLVH